MLVLSRKIGERIRIGNGTGDAAIEVIVKRVAGDRVTLGIAAPAHVKILRGELVLPEIEYESDQTQNHFVADFTDVDVSDHAAAV
jgi:carbon storage regulator